MLLELLDEQHRCTILLLLVFADTLRAPDARPAFVFTLTHATGWFLQGFLTIFLIHIVPSTFVRVAW